MKTYNEITQSKDFVEKLNILNANLKKSLLANNLKPVIIGNLFYDHIQQHPPFYEGPLNKECEQKRIRFFNATQQGDHMFEIGLNGGHSTFLALMANPKLVVTSNDLAEQFIVHPEIYTIEAARTLKSLFRDRFNFIKGDCLTEVPKFVSNNSNVKLNLLHIDGGKETYKQNFLDLLPFLEGGALIIFDDFQQKEVKMQVKDLINAGYLSKDSRFPKMTNQRLTNEILKYGN